MPQFINTNLQSLTAQRNLNKSQASGMQAMQRLSSGLRINSAADDAAGLAVADRMNSQLKGLATATNNSKNGIILSKTAEGALSQMTTNLQRLRELAVQSANGTNTDSDRASMQQEASQYISELTRVSNTTQYNGINLLDGSFKDKNFQIGANNGQSLAVSIASVTTDKIGSALTAGASAIGNSNVITKGDLVINGTSIRTSIAADDTFSTSATSAARAASAIAKVAAINESSSLTNVVATVNSTVAAGSVQTNPPAAAASGTLTINGVTTSTIGVGMDAALNRKAVIDAVNLISGQTGVTAVDSGKSDTGIDLVAADGRNIDVAFTTLTSANTGIHAAGTVQGGYTLQSTDGKDIKIEQGTGDIAHAGLAAGIAKVSDASVSSTVRHSNAALVGNVDVNAGFDFTGANAETFTVSLSGGKTVNVLLNTNMGSGAAYATGLASAINTALGGTYVTAKYLNSDTANAAGELQLMSSDRLTFGTPTLAGGGASAATGLSALIAGQTVGGPDQLREGDLVLNGVNVPAAKASDDTLSDTAAISSAKAASGIAQAAAINSVSSQSGVTATVNATELSSIAATPTVAGTAGAVGAVYINGQTFTMTLEGDAAKDRATAVKKFNDIAGQTGVTATDTGSGLKLTAADGRNISLTIDTQAQYNTETTANGGLGLAGGFTSASIGLADSASDGIAAFDVSVRVQGVGAAAPTIATKSDPTSAAYKLVAANYAETTTSTVSLHSAGKFTVAAGVSGSVELGNSGFQAGTFGGSESGQAIKDIDLSTAAGASKALQAIDNALASVGQETSNMGAVQNRFKSTIASLETASDNLSAARQSIQEADFAAESAELSRTQVLQQAGTAMLAQANQSSQGVLSLLR